MTDKKDATEVQAPTPVVPPAGFEQVLSPMDYPKYEFKPDESVIMIVKAKTSHDFGDADKPKPTIILLCDVDGTTYALYESAGLKEAMTVANPGDTLLVQYQGEKKIPGKPSPMKVYKVWHKRNG